MIKLLSTFTPKNAQIAMSTRMDRINKDWHEPALWLYMVVVFGHWLEHIIQAYQVFILGWARPDAGGVLGLWFPALASSELLHFAYNLLLFVGLWALRPAFRGRSRLFWNVALALQGWHFVEHLLLQLQWLSGYYLFGASQQMGIGQLWLPRVELHFLYNSIVFIPMVLGLFYHLYPPQSGSGRAPCSCTRH
ncbi:MAG: hypothetical protein ACOC9Z_02935 [Chloroflexota bacterium]